MRPIIIFLALVGIGIITWLILARPGEKKEEGTTQRVLPVSKHSDSFNISVAAMLSEYDKLSELFVNWDSAAVPSATTAMLRSVDAVKIDEMEKDSSGIYETALGTIENLKGTLQDMATQTNIRPQREAFNNLTGNIVDFLRAIKYDREVRFLQECPMAFDDTKSAQWISKSGDDKERRNPYLGLKDPKYGKGMLKCGETIKEINHTEKE